MLTAPDTVLPETDTPFLPVSETLMLGRLDAADAPGSAVAAALLRTSAAPPPNMLATASSDANRFTRTPSFRFDSLQLGLGCPPLGAVRGPSHTLQPVEPPDLLDGIPSRTRGRGVCCGDGTHMQRRHARPSPN